MKQFFKSFWRNERLFKSYITSIFAALIAVAYFGLLYTEKSSNVELGAVITLIGLFLRSKDSLIGKK